MAFWSGLNGFEIEAAVPARMNPCGLRSKSQAIKIETGKKIIRIRVTTLRVLAGSSNKPMLIEISFQNTSENKT